MSLGTRMRTPKHSNCPSFRQASSDRFRQGHSKEFVMGGGGVCMEQSVMFFKFLDVEDACKNYMDMVS
jgi:hypothetical protein